MIAMRYRSLILIVAVTLLLSCDKQKVKTAEDHIKGTWIREGTNGVGPGNTIVFSQKNGLNIMSFNCSGSPGPGWPSNAETEYKFENGKLSYLNYYDNSLGFYTVASFNWITMGQEFELEFREVLLFMSANYKVKYKKV
jgi:hypothetical protein